MAELLLRHLSAQGRTWSSFFGWQQGTNQVERRILDFPQGLTIQIKTKQMGGYK